jgi:hypothetical protein
MNVEIGAEAALFPEKEYIKGVFVAVSVDTAFGTSSQRCSYPASFLIFLFISIFNIYRSEPYELEASSSSIDNFQFEKVLNSQLRFLHFTLQTI